MRTNKERIEQLEAELGGVQDGLHRMELDMADRLRQVEETLNRLSDVLLANQEIPNHHREGNDRGQMVVSSKTAKLEFPRFSGDDPKEWFNHVNQFFEFQNTLEAQRVSLASYHLEGEANQWWQWIRRTLREEGRALSWANFEDELWARFGPSKCEDFDEALSRIRQVGSLRNYQREFERLGNRVHGWTQRALVGTFMGGLKMDISDGHKCQGPRILMLESYEDNGNLLCDDVIEEQPVEENHERPPEPEITLHALTGWTYPKTMRIAAKICAHDVIVLIDSGSTHNFISERMANLLLLPVVPMETFMARVANGENLRCQGRFEEIQINLQGTIFSLTLYSLPLTGLDVVLGIQWLEILGSVVCD
ncbi:uncharacterized protein LOC121255036 [Juglans microcarpa x Juglans regia]|uniref:uncharacterized protein LOC121255036 n=1 Tax=Juglans microcarpa x Juglans regia TaxID=2249226 RepID=UPI001B7F2006|nr:uncharacterized protein LOC121255036 [Juglans microcarpa x Juglans regia]